MADAVEGPTPVITDGGPTRLDNLVLLCSKHHHRIHTWGWHIKLRPDGTIEVTQPDGTTRTSDPPNLR